MRSRSGVAMLLTLLASVVIIVGVTIIASVRTREHLTEVQSSDAMRSMQVLRESDRMILGWLNERSKSIVLPPEIDAPIVRVLDDSFTLGRRPATLQITGWDQQGMWPSNAEGLRLNLPLGIVGAFSDLPNLDQPDTSSSRYPSLATPAAIGGVLATHNPWPSRAGQTRSRGTPAININTAPISLLMQAQSQYDVDDLGEIVQKRNQGSMATLDVTNRAATGQEIRFVSVSRVWSFRIEVTVGLVSRSCWCVYANQGGQWSLVQRMMIDET